MSQLDQYFVVGDKLVWDACDKSQQNLQLGKLLFGGFFEEVLQGIPPWYKPIELKVIAANHETGVVTLGVADEFLDS